MQRFLDPEGLAIRGIEHFDAWAATFGEVVDTMEISPDGATLKPRSRFAKFVNLPELVQMFRAFADVQTADMLDLPRPALEGGKPQTVACPMSEEQKELQAGLIKRYDRIRSQKVDPREDNALAITTDGRKLALDGRMLRAGRGFPRLEDQRPGRQRRSHLAEDRADARHADDLLRHGRQPDTLGLLGLRRDRGEAGRPRHPPQPDRHHGRRRHRREEASPVREGPAGHGARPDRLDGQDGHRHQRPEAAGGPAPSRRPVEARRGRAARRPHPPAGQR